MASAKKPPDGKKKNPCPPPPKGKPPRKATGITIDEIGEDMKKEGAPSMGEGKKLVTKELAQRDVCYEDGEEQLQCKLTPLEIEKLDKQAVRLIGEIETKKSQIASTQSMLNGELKARLARVPRCAMFRLARSWITRVPLSTRYDSTLRKKSAHAQWLATN